jgi:hypothetical protein
MRCQCRWNEIKRDEEAKKKQKKKNWQNGSLSSHDRSLNVGGATKVSWRCSGFLKDRPGRSTVDGKRRRFLIKQAELYMDLIPSVLSTGRHCDFLEERSQRRGGQNCIPLSDLHVKPRMILYTVFSPRSLFIEERKKKTVGKEQCVSSLFHLFLDPSWFLDCIKEGNLFCKLESRSLKHTCSLIKVRSHALSVPSPSSPSWELQSFMVWENRSTSEWIAHSRKTIRLCQVKTMVFLPYLLVRCLDYSSCTG